MKTKELGKITYVELEINDRGLFGITLSFEGSGWGCSTFLNNISDIKIYLELAKCYKLSSLLNKPVEVIFNSGCFSSFRILTEVL